MTDESAVRRDPRKPRPGSPTWFAQVSVFSPWGFVQLGLVILVLGFAVYGIGLYSEVSAAANAISEDTVYEGPSVATTLARVTGLGIATIGGIFALIGAVAEGVRIGSLYARHHDDRV